MSKVFSNSQILITGATGFLGNALLKYLQKKKVNVIGTTRQNTAAEKSLVTLGEITERTDWSNILVNKDVVIHCAGIAHVTPPNSDDLYQVNVLATHHLLEQCIIAGVRQFIFISSIGVNGGITTDTPFSITDIPKPINSYTRSKWLAEQSIIKRLETEDMAYTIIRPPLIYGINAPGNFGALGKIIDKKIPLPLARVNNLRSLVGIDNLIDLICCCILNYRAYNQTFLVSDNADVSTKTLLKEMGKVSGHSVYLFPFPLWIINGLTKLLRKEAAYQGLCCSLQVDIAATCEQLNWKPPYTLEEGLKRCFDIKKDRT